MQTRKKKVIKKKRLMTQPPGKARQKKWRFFRQIKKSRPWNSRVGMVKWRHQAVISVPSLKVKQTLPFGKTVA